MLYQVDHKRKKSREHEEPILDSDLDQSAELDYHRCTHLLLAPHATESVLLIMHLVSGVISRRAVARG
jgi:hypothetical protein